MGARLGGGGITPPACSGFLMVINPIMAWVRVDDWTRIPLELARIARGDYTLRQP